MPYPNEVTVDLNRPTNYLGPDHRSWKHSLHRFRLWLAYRHYRGYLRLGMAAVGDCLATHILEVGCGPGVLLSFLETWFPDCEVLGLDYDPRLLMRAVQATNRSRLTRGMAEVLPFSNSSMTALIALHVVEHLYHPKDFIHEVARVLDQNGLFLVATPNPKGIGASVMKARWEGYRDDHVSLHPPEEWAQMIEECGFMRVHSGTTGLSGIPAFRHFPLALFNYVPILLCGALPWNRGEAFVGVFRRNRDK